MRNLIVYYSDDKIINHIKKDDNIYCLNRTSYNFFKKKDLINPIFKCELSYEQKKIIIQEEKNFTQILKAFCNSNKICEINRYNIIYNCTELFRIIKNIEHSIPNINDLCFFSDNEIINFNNKNDFIHNLIIIFKKSKIGFFSLFPLKKYKYNYFLNFLISFNDKMIKFFLKNKKSFFINSFYQLNRLNKYRDINLHAFTIYPVFDPKIFKVVKILFYNFFSKSRYIFIPENTNYNDDLIFDDLKIEYKLIIIEYIISTYNHTQSIIKTFNKYLLSKNFKFSISCNHRPIIQSTVAQLCKNFGISTILIPQGSVSIQRKYPYNYELDRMSDGIGYSNYATHIVAQSKISNEFLNQIVNDKKISILKNYPLLWNYSNSLESYKDDKFTFLLASTMKNYRTKNLMYEDSFEFFDLLKHIYKFIKNNKVLNIKFLVRFRGNEELKINDVKDFEIPNYLEFSSNSLLIDDFKISNILLSNSSTCIEEALNSYLPVGLISKIGYQHIFESKSILLDKYPLYKLDCFNLKKDIPRIVNSIKKNKQKSKFGNFIYDKDEDNFFRTIQKF